MARCWELFNSAKAAAGKVDFADLLEVAAQLIEQHHYVAEAVRRRWAHVTVDEYQDTDPAQQRLLEAIMGEGRVICVVGDPRQAVYGWKGADPSYLTDFVRRHPEVKVFDLTRNYRSTRYHLVSRKHVETDQRGPIGVDATWPGQLGVYLLARSGSKLGLRSSN